MNGKSDPAKDLDAFMDAFSYPAQQGLLIQNVIGHPVHPRADRGNSAAYFSFPELRTLEAHVSEVPPGRATGLHRHSCEALFYVLAGKGYSTVRQDGETERRIDWQAGDLFFTPIHAWHRHFNADPLRSARYLEITTIPLMKSLGAWYLEAADDKQAS